MTKLTKKAKTLQGRVDSNKLYPLGDALVIIKAAATAKFDESIDVAVQHAADGQFAPLGGTPAPTLSRRFQVRGANGYRH
jgi:hypothetical protein